MDHVTLKTGAMTLRIQFCITSNWNKLQYKEKKFKYIQIENSF